MKLPRWVLLLILAVISVAGAQANRSTFDPAATQHPAKQKQDNIVDFTIGHINPNDIDYGQAIEDARWTLIHETVGNINSWFSFIALLLLFYAFVTIYLNSQTTLRRLAIAARFLTFFNNEYARASGLLEQALKRNQELARAIDDQADANPRRKERKREQVEASLATSGLPTPAPPASENISAHDLVSEINRLRQTVSVQETNEKAMRRKISDLTNALEKEKGSNRRLKGE